LINRKHSSKEQLKKGKSSLKLFINVFTLTIDQFKKKVISLKKNCTDHTLYYIILYYSYNNNKSDIISVA